LPVGHEDAIRGFCHQIDTNFAAAEIAQPDQALTA
jgi:hypothetical protein